MINVRVETQEDKITTMVVNGHANHDEYGQDVVCAGVSAIMFGLCNALDEYHTNSKFGVDIDGIPYKAVKGTKGGLMHNKYCVIDNQKVITGSYNWSENAENKNDENAAVMYDFDRASDYSVEFRKMFGS